MLMRKDLADRSKILRLKSKYDLGKFGLNRIKLTLTLCILCQ